MVSARFPVLDAADGNRWGTSGQMVGMESNLRGRVRAGDPQAFEELFDGHAALPLLKVVP
jgi:hypothetical protein